MTAPKLPMLKTDDLLRHVLKDFKRDPEGFSVGGSVAVQHVVTHLATEFIRKAVTVLNENYADLPYNDPSKLLTERHVREAARRLGLPPECGCDLSPRNPPKQHLGGLG